MNATPDVMVHMLRNRSSLSTIAPIVLTSAPSATRKVRLAIPAPRSESHRVAHAALGGRSRVSVLVALVTTGLGHIGAEN